MSEYSKVGWENEPSIATPINASNLEHMDEGIKLANDTASSALSTAQSASSTATSAENMATQAYNIVTEIGNNTAENLIPYPYFETSHTENGLTWEVDENGVISVNGTSTEDTGFTLVSQDKYALSLDRGSFYTLSLGSPLGTLDSTFLTLAGKVSGETITICTDYGEGTDFLVADSIENIPTSLQLVLTVKAGVNFTNMVFKPMLVKGRVVPDYKPYNLSRQSLRQDIDSLKSENEKPVDADKLEGHDSTYFVSQADFDDSKEVIQSEVENMNKVLSDGSGMLEYLDWSEDENGVKYVEKLVLPKGSQLVMGDNVVGNRTQYHLYTGNVIGKYPLSANYTVAIDRDCIMDIHVESGSVQILRPVSYTDAKQFEPVKGASKIPVSSVKCLNELIDTGEGFIEHFPERVYENESNGPLMITDFTVPAGWKIVVHAGLKGAYMITCNTDPTMYIDGQNTEETSTYTFDKDVNFVALEDCIVGEADFVSYAQFFKPAVITSGGSVELTNYYNKTESDERYALKSESSGSLFTTLYNSTTGASSGTLSDAYDNYKYLLIDYEIVCEDSSTLSGTLTMNCTRSSVDSTHVIRGGSGAFTIGFYVSFTGNGFKVEPIEVQLGYAWYICDVDSYDYDVTVTVTKIVGVK